jgi:hypothetical protein
VLATDLAFGAVVLSIFGNQWAANERIGSIGATRWRRWFYDPSRITRFELWPILPNFALLGVLGLVLLSPWFGLLVLPIEALTVRYVRSHESPIRKLLRAQDRPPTDP